MQTEAGDFAALFKYLPLDDDRISATEKTLYPLQINASAEGRPIRPIWQKLLNFGYAREGLLASVQQQIMRAQQEIGFEYIRFHGIFDDNIQIYQENSEGQPVLNFLYADLLTDFLISQGFKLYIELGLMPSALKNTIFLFSAAAATIPLRRSRRNGSSSSPAVFSTGSRATALIPCGHGNSQRWASMCRCSPK